MSSELVSFLQRVLPQMGMRWRGFRRVRNQVRSRVMARVESLGLASLQEYEAYLDAHPDEWTELRFACRITISRFYRDREVWDALRERVFPTLGDDARVWSAGCACGEEPYTIALLTPPSVEILATDIDEVVLERARLGRYPLSSLRDLPGPLRDQAFTIEHEYAQLGEELRARVSFERADLTAESPEAPSNGTFDIVLCRNLVFTYFDTTAQRAALDGLLAHLRPGGFLIAGKKETVPDTPALTPTDIPGVFRPV